MKLNIALFIIGVACGIFAIASNVPELQRMGLALAGIILILVSLRHKIMRIAEML